MDEPRRSMGGWYPTGRGLSAPDLYTAWLHKRGWDDTWERRKAFADETMPEANAALKEDLKTLLDGD